MKLYEIDEAILNLVDAETGEILDFEEFESLQMEREKKLENIALWIKELTAKSEAFKTEIAMLTERKQSEEAKRERLIKYLKLILNGQKFETTRCKVTFRKSSSVSVGNETSLIEWLQNTGHNECLNYKGPSISKSEVKKLINSGVKVPHACIASGESMTVK